MSGIVRANNTGQSGVVSDVDDDVITFMETPSSANLISALTDETGTGAAVFGTSPTLVTPALGTPQSGVMTNVSGTAASLKAGTVTTNANLTGHVTSSGNAAVLGSFSSAQLATALTNETGTGVAVFATDPVLVTPALGTPSSGVLTNVTGLPTAGIVDNAVTLDKMNSITRGSIIVGNASGNPAALAIGSNTYVLTSDATDISWAAASSGPSQAAQSDVLAETNQDTYVPPDLIKYSPGVAKVWAKWNSGSHASLTYNMSGLTDGSSAAETDHAFDDDFTSVDYAFVGSALDNGSFVFICGLKDGTDAAGGMTTINRGADTGTADLNDVSMSIHGIQVV
jgi:hypothetical protein